MPTPIGPALGCESRQRQGYEQENKSIFSEGGGKIATESASEPGAEGGAGKCPSGGSGRAEDGGRGEIVGIACGSTDGAAHDTGGERRRGGAIRDDGKFVGNQFAKRQRGEDDRGARCPRNARGVPVSSERSRRVAQRTAAGGDMERSPAVKPSARAENKFIASSNEGRMRIWRASREKGGCFVLLLRNWLVSTSRSC